VDHAKVHRGQRRAEKRTALKVKAIVRASKPGRWGDGRNLYLVSKTGQSHSWDFSYRLGGKTGSVGLGSLNDVSLAEAREKARACRMTLRAGKAPERARAAAAPRVPTVGGCIEQFIALNKTGWSVSTARIVLFWFQTFVFRRKEALAVLLANRLTP
jgi:Arm DNA-binding domain